jgi:hypothetical protein
VGHRQLKAVDLSFQSRAPGDIPLPPQPVLQAYFVFKIQETFSPFKMGPMRCPETSVRDFHSTLYNTPEKRRSHQHRGGSPKSPLWGRLIFITSRDPKDFDLLLGLLDPWKMGLIRCSETSVKDYHSTLRAQISTYW